MPELPDITIYIEALEKRTVGQRLEQVRVTHPFLVRSVDPPLSEAHGRRVAGYRRIGKRIVMALEDDLFLVLHLMIAGRLHWKASLGAKLPGRRGWRPSILRPEHSFLPRLAANAAPHSILCAGKPLWPSTTRVDSKSSISTCNHFAQRFCAKITPSNVP